MSNPTISLPFTTLDLERNRPQSGWFASSRLRNRVAVITSSILALFLFFRYWNHAVHRTSNHSTASTLQPLSPIYEGVEISDQLAGVTHLIVLAGHAIWLGGQSYLQDKDWILEPYQHGQTALFAAHIVRGAELLAQDASALLVFSGGETRAGAGSRTEAQSYAQLLDLLMSEGKVAGVPATEPGQVFSTEASSLQFRATTENFARDSFDNLLFSLCRFYEVTGRYPTKVSVVGYQFKADRFHNLHRAALKYPETAFVYVGLDQDDPAVAALTGHPIDKTTLSMQSQDNVDKARPQFERDLYACHDPELTQKKKHRNPARRRHGYELSNPLLKPLLEFCPSKAATSLDAQLYPAKLPWS
ncbi:hypothetical protein BCR37DRAFT_378835 [Protomyces lactucae-debilis]|uniref:DUF218 domain-containing protein n=1 Tax=Protomyces lactucae-debilis TaxID=2754530 RepID=A0A1Y2FKC7_PROLT|nr:uncharacterized protein BCR37DRAFT_378835 [Protomyces lactucae-debilis]ORY83824.1 hypothetical protein BCR37DRAFT_378835 [Protomyces lactucae-debilis]